MSTTSMTIDSAQAAPLDGAKMWLQPLWKVSSTHDTAL